MADRLAVVVLDLDDAAAPDGPGLESGVSAAEVERSRGFARAGDARRWLRARYATRLLLAESLGVGPAAVRFSVSDAGKPFVEGGPEFNVAHSGAVGLVAVAGAAPVGVDVEIVRHGLREGQILARVIGEPAVERWTSMGEAGRTAAFFDEWVRFEAAVKCRGTTVAASFGVDVAAGLEVTRLEVGAGYAAAVASTGAGDLTVTRFEWS